MLTYQGAVCQNDIGIHASHVLGKKLASLRIVVLLLDEPWKDVSERETLILSETLC
jgi:hypothetical protein